MPANILIIDDDAHVRDTLCKILSQDRELARHSVQFLTASDGKEGLELYQSATPEVVIVDLLMPRTDGFEVCKAIRQSPRGTEVRLAVTSGVYKDLRVSTQIENEFGARFFAKPYQLKQLVEWVQEAFGDVRAGRSFEDNYEETATEIVASSGDLKTLGLPQLLFDLLERGATGRLLIRRGQVVKQIDLIVGHPASITSNVREETLGHFLVHLGVLQEAQHREVLGLAARKRQRLGETLIELGHITPNDLINYLTAQVRYKLVRSLRWEEGTWDFRPMTSLPGGPRGNALDLTEVVLRGLAETAQIDPPSPTVVALRHRPLGLSERGRALLPEIGVHISKSFIEGFSPGCTMDDLLTAGVDRVGMLESLDALLACGGLSVAAGEPGRAATSGDEMTLGELIDSRDRSARIEDLYSTLFDSFEPVKQKAGAAPLLLPHREDSGVLDVRFFEETTRPDHESEEILARRDLLEEFLRVQQQSFYEILEVDQNANSARIAAALDEKRSTFSLSSFESVDLGRDFQKLELLLAVYAQAEQALLDPVSRRAYDAELRGANTEPGAAPSLDAEMTFRDGEEHLRAERHAEAVAAFENAVAAAPSDAAYRAHLGWALFLLHGRTEAAADLANPHVNQALAINPDDLASNEIKGIVTAEVGGDVETALLHLSKALEEDPFRSQALESIERLRHERGEYRKLERQYRRLIFRIGNQDPPRVARLWAKLGQLHHRHTGDAESAKIAFEAALEHAKGDPMLQAEIADMRSGASDHYHEERQLLRTQWLRNPTDPAPLIQLYEMSKRAEKHDHVFWAASGLVALDVAPPDALALYARYRARFLLRAQAAFDPRSFGLLQHHDDWPIVGELFALLAPAIEEVFPAHEALAEIEQAVRIEESKLPDEFRRVRAYIAHMLGIDVPRVYARADYERQIHVAASTPAVLLAGDEVLHSPEKLELAFRLGRAMSYLLPGRTAAAARPARVLKQSLLAAYMLRTPAAGVADPDGTMMTLRERIRAMPVEVVHRVSVLVDALSTSGEHVNLSAWTRALGRTADRLGLVLTGDLQVALRFARDTTDDDGIRDLIDFAVSGRHGVIRELLGLSIDV